jgi:hypothetical protein
VRRSKVVSDSIKKDFPVGLVLDRLFCAGSALDMRVRLKDTGQDTEVWKLQGPDTIVTKHSSQESYDNDFTIGNLLCRRASTSTDIFTNTVTHASRNPSHRDADNIIARGGRILTTWQLTL